MTPDSNISGTEEAQAVNVALDQGTNYIAEAITGQWGERCSEYAEGCACCEAWKQYDGLLSQSAALASAREVIDGKPGTMPLSDEDLDTIEACVRNDQHQRILALEIMELTRLYRAAREWKGR